MSYFPALDDLARDRHLGRNAWRLYMLLKDDLEIGVPAEIKMDSYAFTLRLRKSSVAAALDLLIRRGYLADHGRTFRRIRRVALLLRRKEMDQVGHVPKLDNHLP